MTYRGLYNGGNRVTVAVRELGNSELTSLHRNHHGFIVKSPDTWESGLGKKMGDTVVLCASCNFQRSQGVFT